MADLNIMHINVNGLRARRPELELYLKENKPDIICMNETKMCGKTYPSLTNYRLASFRDRDAGNRGGGVAIYVLTNIDCEDISPNINDFTAVSLNNGGIEYAIVAYYCPPKDKLDVNTLSTYINKYENIIIMGDLNARHQFYGSTSSNSNGDSLFNLVERFDLVIANNLNQATKLSQYAGEVSIIDYAIISKDLIGRLNDCHTGEDVGSDHSPLHLHLHINNTIAPIPTKLYRPITKCNWNLFQSSLLRSAEEITHTVSLNTHDIDDKVAEIERHIQTALNEACPLKPAKQYSFSTTNETLQLIKAKRKLRKRAQKDPTLRTEFNRLQRLVQARLQQERLTSWQKATGDLNHRSGKAFWDTFKRLTKTGKKTSVCPRITLDSGAKSKNPREVADAFAQTLKIAHKTHQGPIFDYRKLESVNKYISKHNSSFKPNFNNTTPSDIGHTLVEPIDLEELTRALRKSKSRGAPGPDGISFLVLKQIPEQFQIILLTIFNECLSAGYFPLRWKEAHGVMIHKPGKDSSYTTSYRPISLLNTTGKLFERIINSRLMGHLLHENFFNEWQRAYLPKMEASEIVYRLREEITETCKRKKWKTVAFSLDVEKAFDSVWHDGLRYKLRELGLPEVSCRLLSSFLTDRTISVRVNSELSTPVKLEAGTPQGSVLSPLLFLIYVNDIPLQSCNGIRAGQFADDITGWSSDRHTYRIHRNIQNTLNKIEKWCCEWRIKLNADKTQLVVFKHNYTGKKTFIENLYVFREEIEESDSIKVLGVRFGKAGSMLGHCKERAAEANQRTNLLRLLRGRKWGANTLALRRLYVQYIRPVLEHGAVASATAADASIRHLETAERRALRVVLGISLMQKQKNSVLYDRLSIQPIKDRLQDIRLTTINRFGNKTSIKQLEDLRSIVA